MKALMALAAPLLLSAVPAAAPPPQQVSTGVGTLYYDGMPPLRFQGDATAIVIFTGDVTSICPQKVPPGLTLIACTQFTKGGVPIVVLPNPVPYGLAGDQYAQWVAHEMGHVQGWAGDHPK